MVKGWQGLLFSGAILLAGCQHATSAASGVRVMTAEGQMRQQIVASDSVAELKTIWANKREVLVKMRPVFNHRVEFGTSAVEQWLYSDAGYAVLASEPYGTMYLMAERERINTMLGIKSNCNSLLS